MGFEPTRAEHIGLAGRRLNHSATVSMKMNNGSFTSKTTLQIGRCGSSEVTAVGFEPTRIAPSELESDALDHSATLSYRKSDLSSNK